MNPSPTSPRRPSRQPWTKERLIHERAVAIGAALEPGTALAYSSALQSYLSFCHAHQLPVEPTTDTLSFYVVYMCAHIKPQSVEAYLSGICARLEPFFPHVHDNRRHAVVTKCLVGCKKMYTTNATRKSALPHALLSQILSTGFPSPSHDEFLFRAILAVGWHGIMRLGELVWPDNLDLQDYRKVIMHLSVEVLPGGFSFILPGHKGDRLFEGNRVVVLHTCSPDDPIQPFSNYLKSRDSLFPYNPELWLRADGSIPHRRWFISLLHVFLPKEYGGHSLRSGGATALAEAGIPEELIRRAGRWSSDAFEIYIRNHPTLLASILMNRCSDT